MLTAKINKFCIRLNCIVRHKIRTGYDNDQSTACRYSGTIRVISNPSRELHSKIQLIHSDAASDQSRYSDCIGALDL